MKLSFLWNSNYACFFNRLSLSCKIICQGTSHFHVGYLWNIIKRKISSNDGLLCRWRFQRMTLWFLMVLVTRNRLRRDVNRFVLLSFTKLFFPFSLSICCQWFHNWELWLSLLKFPPSTHLPTINDRLGRQLRIPLLIMTRRSYRRDWQSFLVVLPCWRFTRELIYSFLHLHRLLGFHYLLFIGCIELAWWIKKNWEIFCCCRLEELVKRKLVRRRIEWQML